MITIIYSLCLFVCVVMLLNMAQKNYNNIDIYHWTVLILIPIIIMAYLLKTTVTTPDAAYVLMCFQYLDSAFLSAVVIFYLLHTAGVTARPWMKIALYGLGIVHMVIVCICIHTDLYYSKVEVIESSRGNMVHVSGGPLMIYHYIYLAIIAVCLAAVVVIGIRNKGRYAFSTMFIYLSIPLVTFVLYFVEGFAGADYTMLPVAYAGIDVIIALNYEIAHTHDIAFLIADHHSSDTSRAYAAIGMNGKFLSCNEKSYEFLPFLKEIKVNDRLPKGDHIADIITDLIDSFERDGMRSVRYRLGDLACECDISYFSLHEGGDRHGYLLDIHDATEEQEAYDLIQSYNDRLNEEVREKTENIRDMQRKIVLGMAGIIENRDNNTGGHVKRTSDIIKIIVDEIMARGSMDISEQMAEDIVRAAPTHDLGKVAIDNSILNKPGKFTDEEYAIMKTHSTKSGEMVMILLDGVEEERFVKVAYNVARYHHERWDGRGYPEGLVGTMIPLEARIMAIADVYDALVSKRVYKDPMSFEKSASIMCECMGTQFDPNLKAVFLGCREKLEEYYIAAGEQ